MILIIKIIELHLVVQVNCKERKKNLYYYLKLKVKTYKIIEFTINWLNIFLIITNI